MPDATYVLDYYSIQYEKELTKRWYDEDPIETLIPKNIGSWLIFNHRTNKAFKKSLLDEINRRISIYGSL
jgi:hypothetical protein